MASCSRPLRYALADTLVVCFFRTASYGSHRNRSVGNKPEPEWLDWRREGLLSTRSRRLELTSSGHRDRAVYA